MHLLDVAEHKSIWLSLSLDSTTFRLITKSRFSPPRPVPSSLLQLSGLTSTTTPPFASEESCSSSSRPPLSWCDSSCSLVFCRVALVLSVHSFFYTLHTLLSFTLTIRVVRLICQFSAIHLDNFQARRCRFYPVRYLAPSHIVAICFARTTHSPSCQFRLISSSLD